MFVVLLSYWMNYLRIYLNQKNIINNINKIIKIFNFRRIWVKMLCFILENV
jgi:hypothetical protein